MPNPKQNEAIQKCLASKEFHDKAFIILFDLLNDEEETAFYQVRYNDRSRLAMDFKQWEVKSTLDDLDKKGVYDNARGFVQGMLDQLMYNLCENEVIVKHIVVETDGSIE